MTNLPVTFESVQHEALVSIWYTAVFLQKETRRISKQFSLSETQFNVLMILKYSDTILSQNDIAGKMLIDKANITGIIDALEKKKLVKRNSVSSDRRRYSITLTNSGAELISQADSFYYDRVCQVMAGISREECLLIISITASIRKNLSELAAAI